MMRSISLLKKFCEWAKAIRPVGISWRSWISQLFWVTKLQGDHCSTDPNGLGFFLPNRKVKYIWGVASAQLNQRNKILQWVILRVWRISNPELRIEIIWQKARTNHKGDLFFYWLTICENLEFESGSSSNHVVRSSYGFKQTSQSC